MWAQLSSSPRERTQRPRRIAGLLEHLGHECVLEVDAACDARHWVEVHLRLLAEVPRIPTSKSLRPRRRAESVHIIIVKDNRLVTQFIQFWCEDLVEAIVPAHVVPAEIVDEREYDVRLFRSGNCVAGRGKQCDDGRSEQHRIGRAILVLVARHDALKFERAVSQTNCRFFSRHVGDRFIHTHTHTLSRGSLRFLFTPRNVCTTCT